MEKFNAMKTFQMKQMADLANTLRMLGKHSEQIHSSKKNTTEILYENFPKNKEQIICLIMVYANIKIGFRKEKSQIFPLIFPKYRCNCIVKHINVLTFGVVTQMVPKFISQSMLHKFN